MSKESIKSLGIYIHVPFCLKRCPYCSFYSDVFSKDVMNSYCNALLEAIKKWGDELKANCYVDTIYFGGGTPSLLGEEDVYKILNYLSHNFYLREPEITLEVNPFKADELSFYELKKAGVNRISVGMQSVNDPELILLGRQHRHKHTVHTINEAKKAGFNNISLDVMINIPSQTEKSLINTINFCQISGVQHVSAYMLKTEEGTPFFEYRNKLNFPSEEEQCKNYINTVALLEAKGFKQYEISNFSKSNFYSRHNVKYWNADDYLGLGPSAHSLICGERFYYKSSLKDFISGKGPVFEGQTTNLEEEYIMLQLRLKNGLVNEKFFEKFHKVIPEIYFNRAAHFEKLGLLEAKPGDFISLKTRGFLVSNRIISCILFG